MLVDLIKSFPSDPKDSVRPTAIFANIGILYLEVLLADAVLGSKTQGIAKQMFSPNPNYIINISISN